MVHPSKLRKDDSDYTNYKIFTQKVRFTKPQEYSGYRIILQQTEHL